MRCESLDKKGRLSEKVFVVFTLGDGFPLLFIFSLPTLLTHTHTHTYSHISSPTLPSFMHTKTYTHALTNTNCFLLTVIWTDMFALLLIWMSLHCLASFAILKTPLLSLSKLQADGGESAWRSLRSCESCFFFPPLSLFWRQYFIFFYIYTERIFLIYSMTHLCEGATFFAASHHISSLSQGWYFCVNLHSQTHYK